MSILISMSNFGALLPYPATDGRIVDYSEFIDKAHEQGALATVAADLLSLTLLLARRIRRDIASSTNDLEFRWDMRAHAAFFSTREEYKRQMPPHCRRHERRRWKAALRLALQTKNSTYVETKPQAIYHFAGVARRDCKHVRVYHGG